jgi:hypothetical protein
LNLNFENKNPWTLQLAYSVRVITPSKMTVVEGRRNRAMSALRYLDSDAQALDDRRSYVIEERRQLEKEIFQLEQEVNERANNSWRPMPQRASSASRGQGLRSNVWPPENDFNP